MKRAAMMALALSTTVLVPVAAKADPIADVGAYSRVATIQMPGNPLTSFDISWVDQRTQRYYLADRSNKSIDIFDAAQATYLGRVTGFVGINTALGAAANDTAGPNGVVPVGKHEVWAGDGDSTVKVINLDSMTITDVINTGGKNRADEMAVDEKDHVFIVVNDAEEITSDPNSGPFLTLISTEPGHKILGKIVLHDATNGTEQPVYDSQLGLFFVAVPQLGTDVENGEILKVNPRTAATAGAFVVTGCQPHGLVQGPRQTLFLGCNETTPSLTQKVMDARTGAILASIPGVGGTDESWYDPMAGRYFSGASSQPGGAVLGIMDARNNTLLQTIPTTTSAHSVAADSLNGRVFVPFTPVASDAACPNGCISVFAPAYKYNMALADLRDFLSQLDLLH